jgi:hypothetical protein
MLFPLWFPVRREVFHIQKLQNLSTAIIITRNAERAVSVLWQLYDYRIYVCR